MVNNTDSRRERRELMARRDKALAAGDVATFQALTAQIASLHLPGVRPLTTKDIEKYVGRKS